MRKLLALALLLIAISPVHAAIFGPLFSGSSQTAPPTGTAPVVTSLACTIALPVTNGVNVNLVGGGSCAYTATCASAACTGINVITGWAITTQSTANSFSITNAGLLQGGSAGGSVTTGSYTVTVTATNSTGTSPGVVQSISVFQPPVVASLSCTIKSPIANNTNVTLQAGGNCQYTATCGGGACSGANAISGWSVLADTCFSCYQVTSSGVLQGSTNAATVTNQTDTVTIVATNAGGNSPGVGQTVVAVTVPAITNQNFSEATIINPQTIGTMVASPTPSSWAITAVSSVPSGASTSDFAISSGGVITTTSSAPGDVPSSSTVTISMTATNATGTSPTGTGVISVGNTCPQGTALPDGCPGAPTGSNLRNSGALVSYAHRPAWNVAGVDYGVGPNPNVTITIANPAVFTETAHGHIAGTKLSCYTYGTLPAAIPTSVLSGSVTQVFVIAAGLTTNTYAVSLTSGGSAISTLGNTQSGTHYCLKDPTQSLPSGISLGSSSINLTGTGAVLDHYDASLHGGLVVAASGTNQTVSNNVVVYGTVPAGAGQNQTISCGNSSINCTVNNNYVDGGGAGANNSELISLDYGNGSTVNAFYNYAINYPNDVSQFATPSISNSGTLNFKWNYAVGGPLTCGHADLMQIGSGTYTTSVIFNTYYAPAPACGTQGWELEGNAGQTTIVSGELGWNTTILPTTPGNGGTAVNFFTGITSGTATGVIYTVHDNYFDPTSLGGLIRPGNNANNSCSNNINMITGAVISSGCIH